MRGGVRYYKHIIKQQASEFIQYIKKSNLNDTSIWSAAAYTYAYVCVYEYYPPSTW